MKCVFADRIRGGQWYQHRAFAEVAKQHTHLNHGLLYSRSGAGREGQSVLGALTYATAAGSAKRSRQLKSKLLRKHTLFKTVVAVEHHEKLDGARLLDLNLYNVARFEMIGDGADRALLSFENRDRYVDLVRNERTAPAPRPERADRRNGQKRRLDRQNRPVGGEIVSRRSGRRCDQDAVADQLLQTHLAVDGDLQLSRLIALAK